jgi:PadR family transcriptional regulator PadR
MSRTPSIATFELYVMLALARLGDEAYGITVRQEIEERTGRPISIGAVYATLGRLDEKGLISFRISDPLPIKGGRSRKYFHLTRQGRLALRHSTAIIGRMTEGLDLSMKAEKTV